VQATGESIPPLREGLWLPRARLVGNILVAKDEKNVSLKRAAKRCGVSWTPTEPIRELNPRDWECISTGTRNHRAPESRFRHEEHKAVYELPAGRMSYNVISRIRDAGGLSGGVEEMFDQAECPEGIRPRPPCRIHDSSKVIVGLRVICLRQLRGEQESAFRTGERCAKRLRLLPGPSAAVKQENNARGCGATGRSVVPDFDGPGSVAANITELEAAERVGKL
jgi:hypothetical protein